MDEGSLRGLESPVKKKFQRQKELTKSKNYDIIIIEKVEKYLF